MKKNIVLSFLLGGLVGGIGTALVLKYGQCLIPNIAIDQDDEEDPAPEQAAEEAE